MKILHLNLSSGISGDMLLAALISSGAVSQEFLNKKLSALSRLGIKPPYINVKKNTRRHPPSFSVVVPDDYHFESPRAQVLAVKKFPSEKPVREFALAVLDELISAESRVHKTQKEKVHFHQLNSKDTLIDILAAALAAHKISPDKIISTPLNVGRPNPATLEILKKSRSSIYSDCPDYELATPTGAAILSALKPQFAELGAIELEAYGFGAGLTEIPGRDNTLRLIIGRAETHAPRFSPEKSLPGGNEPVILIETNIDDMIPEKFPLIQESIIRLGARDVWLENIIMKRGRPGVKLCALVRHSQLEEISFFILKNTTSSGVRFVPYSRLSLPRIETPRLKKYILPDGKTRIKKQKR